jgi:hypothetical protein
MTGEDPTMDYVVIEIHPAIDVAVMAAIAVRCFRRS